jgi:hypothetical protein
VKQCVEFVATTSSDPAARRLDRAAGGRWANRLTVAAPRALHPIGEQPRRHGGRRQRRAARPGRRYPEHYRAGDDDRQRVADRLREALDAGR